MVAAASRKRIPKSVMRKIARIENPKGTDAEIESMTFDLEIVRFESNRVIYCNPQVKIKDLKLLSRKREIGKSNYVDLSGRLHKL